MKMAVSYLRRAAGPAALLALFAGIFALVAYLAGTPAPAVGYAALLCAAAGLGCLGAGYVRYGARRRALERALRDVSLPAELPEPGDGLEADYQKLIAAMRAEMDRRAAADGRAMADRLDWFTAWVHQIKTPIAGMALLLDDGEPDRGEMKNQLFRIEQYAEMALGYLRLDGGRDLVIARHELDAVVRRAVKKYAGWFIRRGVALDYEPLREQVLTDEKWLGFVIEQVLSNALKYTPRGGVRIYAEPGPVLVIRDTGVGIAPEDLPMVFEKGYTGFNGRQGDGRSTGIGLYLCRRVCRMLGHGIALRSRPGEGTEVRIDLTERPLGVE